MAEEPYGRGGGGGGSEGRDHPPASFGRAPKSSAPPHHPLARGRREGGPARYSAGGIPRRKRTASATQRSSRRMRRCPSPSVRRSAAPGQRLTSSAPSPNDISRSPPSCSTSSGTDIPGARSIGAMPSNRTWSQLSAARISRRQTSSETPTPVRKRAQKESKRAGGAKKTARRAERPRDIA